MNYHTEIESWLNNEDLRIPSEVFPGAIAEFKELQDELARYKETVLEAVMRLEQAVQMLADGKSGLKYDPSWIRPRSMTREQVQGVCEQGYHQIHTALAALKAMPHTTPHPPPPSFKDRA